MAMLTYWVAEVENDSQAYNLRAKSKKEVVEMLARQGYRPDGRPINNSEWAGRYSRPHKVQVYYRDAFDLMEQCMSEGSLDESKR